MKQAPLVVRLIRDELKSLMATPDPCCPEQTIGTAKAGIYAFLDYDTEPIYVGQTSKSFSDRIGRHMTGQRSDPVAKFILDPFEVAYVRMWSLPHIANFKGEEGWNSSKLTAARREMLHPYEYTVYAKLKEESKFNAVLNEGYIQPAELVELPECVTGRIIPDELWEERKHADVRIARRASTIARLSQTISERVVSEGMRRTLLLQSKRLEWLAQQRVTELGIEEPKPSDRVVRAIEAEL